MSRNIMLFPIGTNIGLTSIILGMIRAIERQDIIKLSVFKAISQPWRYIDAPDLTTTILRKHFNLTVNEPLKMSYVESLISSNQKDLLMEEIIANYYASTQNATVVLIEGLIPTSKHQFIQSINFEVAKMLNAEIVFVMSQDNETIEQIKKRIKLTCSSLNSIKNNNISGIIINKFNAPINNKGYNYFDISAKIFNENKITKIDQNKLRNFIQLPIIGVVPWNMDLIAVKAIDIARHLHATIIQAGDIHIRYVKSVIFCTHNIMHMLEYFKNDSLLITSVNSLDMIVAACLAAINGVEIGAILLTDGYEIDPCIMKLCKRAFVTGLPMFIVNTNIWQIFLRLQNLNLEISIDDYKHIKKVQEYIANYISIDWIKKLSIKTCKQKHYSPYIFRYQLTELARKADKRIVLPEGDEPRTIKAASICASRGIATCVMLGDPDKINHVASSQNIMLNANIEIINPELIRENYINRFVELRSKKGINDIVARAQLKDNVVLGTMMLEQNEVDGLVSGAIHTTANTIRPSLQLIKPAPGNSLVSSIFFMLLPEQVYVYGDCAINPDPTSEQLAEIAIQSANSATSFGIEPRVAMLSYSTGTSGAGKLVEKVREATYIAQTKRPDLMIDGPLQYDAAVNFDIAKLKAPHSPVAGQATVFIFPDLNTGNITYKAVQRSVGLISIGPMLQGMRKPVNDLSRGALVEDIVYTIALTAIQSQNG